MALLHLYGFDALDDEWDMAPAGWGYGQPSFVYYDTSSGAKRMTNSRGSIRLGALITGGVYIQSPLVVSATSTVVVGFGYKFEPGGDANQNSTWNFKRQGYTQISLRKVGSYETPNFDIYDGDNNLLGNTGVVAAYTKWYFFEIKVVIHASAGSVTLHRDGAEIYSLTGVQTNNTSAPDNLSDSFQFIGGSHSDVWIDDFYMLDSSGSVNNDFLGEIRIDTIYPSGAGTHTDWTPNTGDNYAAVDEAPPDRDTTYVSGDASGEKDLYAFTDLPDQLGADVYAVSMGGFVRKASAGLTKIRPLFKLEDAIERISGEWNLPTSWTFAQNIFEISPRTGSAWTEKEINSGEFGFEYIGA